MDFKKGDRIEMVYMPNDPLPILPGTQGTVTYADEVAGPEPFTQIGVEWDNGRSLSVVVPPDTVRKIT